MISAASGLEAFFISSRSMRLASEGMGTVRGGECVIDEYVAEPRKLRNEIGIVALLARMKPRVFQTEHVTRTHGIDRVRC